MLALAQRAWAGGVGPAGGSLRWPRDGSPGACGPERSPGAGWAGPVRGPSPPAARCRLRSRRSPHRRTGGTSGPDRRWRTAQRAVGAALLWHLRVLAGWQPVEGSQAVRALAGWFEIANVDDLLRAVSGAGRPEPFRLGRLGGRLVAPGRGDLRRAGPPRPERRPPGVIPAGRRRGRSGWGCAAPGRSGWPRCPTPPGPGRRAGWRCCWPGSGSGPAGRRASVRWLPRCACSGPAYSLRHPFRRPQPGCRSPRGTRWPTSPVRRTCGRRRHGGGRASSGTGSGCSGVRGSTWTPRSARSLCSPPTPGASAAALEVAARGGPVEVLDALA